MAKVVGALHSSEARGRVGGIVFNSHRGMGVCRVKHAPSQPRTSLQLKVRAIAVNLVRAWSNCLHQADWNAYAAVHPYTDGMGLTIRAAGVNWYTALNARLNALKIGSVETPPVDLPPTPVVGLVLTPSAGQISAAWDGPSEATDRIQFWIDGPHSAGRIGSLPRARLTSQPEAASSPEVLTGLLTGRYSVYVRSMSETDGQVSQWALEECDVT